MPCSEARRMERLAKRSQGKSWLIFVCLAYLAGVAACGRDKQPENSNPEASRHNGSAATTSAGAENVAASTVPVSKQSADERGAALYAQHCAACHGERGDGKGLAARFLFPKPRDFRSGRFRLVSTSNGIPTEAD